MTLALLFHALLLVGAGLPASCATATPHAEDCCLRELAFRKLIELARPDPDDPQSETDVTFVLSDNGVDPEPELLRSLMRFSPNAVPISFLGPDPFKPVPANAEIFTLQHARWLSPNRVELRVRVSPYGGRPWAITYVFVRTAGVWAWSDRKDLVEARVTWRNGFPQYVMPPEQEK